MLFVIFVMLCNFPHIQLSIDAGFVLGMADMCVAIVINFIQKHLVLHIIISSMLSINSVIRYAL